MVVSTAMNGIQLLEHMADDGWIRYDLILLDWMMPEMDGVTACRLLRERIPNDLLPVIFLTAKTDSGALEKGFEVGGTDFITKPLNRKEVIARVICQGYASRHARARFFDSIPVVPCILTQRPFWQMRPTSGTKQLFVISFHTTTTKIGGPSDANINSIDGTCHPLDGPAFLHYFQVETLTFESDWKFHELAEDNVTFLAPSTTVEQVKRFLRTILSAWAANVLPSHQNGGAALDKPRVTVGVDYCDVRAHLFGERLPMLAVVESCSSMAQSLARQGIKHEDISFSMAAEAMLSPFG